MKRNYYFPWHRLQSARQTKDQSWWNNISETENELLRLSSLMLVTVRFPKQHHSWPFGVTSIVAKVQELCLGSIGIWLQLHCHFQQDMFSRSCSKMTWIGKRSLAENRQFPRRKPTFLRWLGEKWTDVFGPSCWWFRNPATTTWDV